MRFMYVLLFSAFAVLSTMAPVAAADLSEPQMAIEDASNKLKQRLQDPNFPHDFQKINAFVQEVIYPHVDFDLISSLVLGKLWKDASPSEKENFKREFQTLLIRTYSRAFFEFKDWSIRFLPVTPEEDERKVLIKTEVLQPGLQPIAVNYRMLNVKGQWKAYDIMIEGVSLVTNYRTSFKNEVERTGSLQEVINQLAKRNTEALSAKNNS
ncbi:toluene tolerance protein [Methylomonas koyamae]|uniref:Toluene tolerance protein n=3 Tax=Methylococcaceae TaxID=403 RepID=A0A177PIG8_9GAMM|nr:ABC transporter substrate-binding protein [Methylomonas koyamae]ANE54159.1 toluene tolerance protein [Methylomonas sp. DH-1]OAI15877.1 toluene tolerance protein [Methylomonas koyamae]OAI30095.1 toluene tolerance protein [Methylomonas koyamae]